ncbi:MAG TPA: hypothetical protein VM689_05645 [Aliidongia sp.]|nr:hypothetical protein [Aliidongia sp.]
MRVVVETRKRHEATAVMAPDGLSATVALPALRPVSPPNLTPPLKAIRAPPQHGLFLEFRSPVTLRHSMVLPTVAQPGYRLVLDFAIPGKPVPPPESALQQAGFAPEQFGSHDSDLLTFLKTLPDTDGAPVRMTVGSGSPSARPLIHIGRQTARFGRFQMIYHFTPADHRLAVITAEWGNDPDHPLDDDQLQDLLDGLSDALASAGFKPTSSEMNAPLAGGGRIGFSGLDGKGRLATLAIEPLPHAGKGHIFLRLTMADPSIAE